MFVLRNRTHRTPAKPSTLVSWKKKKNPCALARHVTTACNFDCPQVQRSSREPPAAETSRKRWCKPTPLGLEPWEPSTGDSRRSCCRYQHQHNHQHGECEWETRLIPDVFRTDCRHYNSFYFYPSLDDTTAAFCWYTYKCDWQRQSKWSRKRALIDLISLA